MNLWDKIPNSVHQNRFCAVKCEFGHLDISKIIDDVGCICIENTMKLTSLGHLLRYLVVLTVFEGRIMLVSLILFVLPEYHVNCEAQWLDVHVRLTDLSLRHIVTLLHVERHKSARFVSRLDYLHSFGWSLGVLLSELNSFLGLNVGAINSFLLIASVRFIAAGGRNVLLSTT